jgi:DNA-binding response OmpR family regulator
MIETMQTLGQRGEANPGTPPPADVLIVDDSLTVRMDLGESFETAGFRITLCDTLAAARQVIAQKTFSLAVLDLLLPDGDGLDLLREIKAAARPIPVLLLSTEAEISDRIRGLAIGADEYIGKPYDRNHVLDRARQLMGSARQAPQARCFSILLIDDSATFRNEFKSLLEAQGYRVQTAESGEEGLSTAFAIRPDAVIIDQVLNGPLDGRMVVRRLKQDVTLRNTPCLLLTASVEAGGELRALEAGADAYLSKEADLKVVFARLAAILRSGRPAPVLESPAFSLLGAKRILAVDDSPTFLYAVSSELRKEGYDVVQACSGREALGLLKVQTVDCILLDVQMPEMSGLEVCKAIRTHSAFRKTPLLMLTAMEGSDAAIAGINAGADDYVSKSSDFSILKARVRAQLRRKQFEDEYRIIREELLHKQLETSRAKAAQELAETRAAMTDELEKKNRELEAFGYSVSHDLRAPLRTIRGFSQAVLDDFGEELPAGARLHLSRVLAAASRMSGLIDALLELSRTGRMELEREPFDFSRLARSVCAEIAESNQERHVTYSVQDGLAASADAALLRVVLNNLLGNAWKFTGKTGNPVVEVGALPGADPMVYFVRDNGVGFDPAHAGRIFQPFERLHPATDFAGAGIGLATVRRIVERHQGRIWVESEIGKGATFLFTLEERPALKEPPALVSSGTEWMPGRSL